MYDETEIPILLTYELKVDSTNTDAYPDYVQEIEDPGERAVAMVKFDSEDGQDYIGDIISEKEPEKIEVKGYNE